MIMQRDFDYRPNRRVIVSYKGGRQYDRVPEAAVRAITKAGAGSIVESSAASDA